MKPRLQKLGTQRAEGDPIWWSPGDPREAMRTELRPEDRARRRPALEPRHVKTGQRVEDDLLIQTAPRAAASPA